ncbi:hypothetical protein Q7P37_001887 [Cladosporium fusiforme]
MSARVIPARRRHAEDDDEELSSQHSATNKRTRVDEETSDGSESERPILPNSYLRSPNGKNASTNGNTIQPHQPGSLVRVRMIDFVTYTDAEFALGPNLNMIIGPNGTGKSTLVCAICLGLGWETKHLGRAKDISEFVKHGAKRATIEIELAADPARQRQNPVITTKISREGNKVEYLIDGKKENKKRAMDLARSFSIQVDNLCQFLPQDRVVEFAALSPVELLAQTQRAAAPEQMTEWHQKLKEMRREQKLKEDEQHRLTEDLGRLENRQRMQQADVERLRERSDLQERLTAYEKFRPFPQYRVAKQQHTEAKDRKKEAERELKRLQRQMEPNLRAVNSKEEYLERMTKNVKQKQGLVNRMESNTQGLHADFEKAAADLEGIQGELEAGNNSIKLTKQKVPDLNRTINSLKTAMENAPAPVDTAAMNEELRNKSRQIRDINERVNELRDQISTLNQQGNQRKTIVQRAEQEMVHLQSQAGQQANKLRSASRNGDAAKAWDWIQANKDQFKGNVFGPAILECSIKDPRLASAVETMITQSELLAFTVTSREDFDLLQRQLYTHMRLTDVNIRSAPPVGLPAYKHPCSTEQLNSYGLEGWILDLIEGPPEVLAMLCDNRNIHNTAYTSGDVPADQHENLSRSPISSWVTNTQSYQVTRRREYGDHATSTRVIALRPARFFTNAPIDHRAEEDLTRRIREAEHDMEEIKEQITNLREEEKANVHNRQELEDAKKELDKEKSDKQRAFAQFQGLPLKLDAAERKLADAKAQISAHRDSQQEIVAKGDRLALDKGQLALNYGNSVEALHGTYVKLFEAEIMKIEAESDLAQLAARHNDERAQLAEVEAAYEKRAEEAAVFLAEGKRLQELCIAVSGDGMTDREQEVMEEVQRMDPDELDTTIQSTQARLEMTTGGNTTVIAEYEERAKKIERDHGKLANVENALQELQQSIEEIKGQWEPELDTLVGKISEAFAENFAKIQCAGEVGVHKDEDFEQWAIQIRVKFRESEPLSVLDSHRQSGGERAVSTIFYLMALQSLARAPFRLVDEINQGMDPRNERLVHSRLVNIACASAREGGGGGSQYFLITPKLLSGLEYHPKMKVHCIASGEHMPDDHAKMDFAALAKKTLALKAAGLMVGKLKRKAGAGLRFPPVGGPNFIVQPLHYYKAPLHPAARSSAKKDLVTLKLLKLIHAEHLTLDFIHHSRQGKQDISHLSYFTATHVRLRLLSFDNMAETRNIVFLGASYAGLSATHYFLKHVYSNLPTSESIKYKVILVNASPKFFQRHASPRAIASSELMPNDKIFLDIAPGFEQYGDKVQFLVGKATSWDPENRTVSIKEPSGKELLLDYYALVLATGSKTSSLTQSSHGNSHEEIEAALAAISSRVKDVKSIVIAGGGPAGVETAGEIAELLNGTPGWFKSRVTNPKAQITLLTNSDKLLPSLRPAIAKQAEQKLTRLGVQVKYNTKVASSESSSNNQTKVTLANGTEIFTEIYLPAIGITPLSSYVPAHLLDPRGRVLATEATLRVIPEAGPRVYALGDITSFTRGGIPEIQLEVPVLASNMQRDLLAAHGEKPQGKDRVYVPELRELQIVPVGRGGGVGAIWGWRVPSWAVWLIKGRDFMVGGGVDKVFGKPEVKEVKWQAEGQTA